MSEKPKKAATPRKRSGPVRAPVKTPASATQLEAIGYIRVSTSEQADSGLSLSAQRSRIEAQAEANGWKLLSIYEDAGLTGKTLDRPGLQTALRKLKPGRVLLSMKLDRLTRSVRDLHELIEIIDQSGAEWATVMEKFDTTTPTGRMILHMLISVSQWEAETIADRTKTALAVKRERRERLGTTPLGFRTVTDDDGNTCIEEDEQEMETVRLARRLRAENHSLRQIAEYLTATGHKTKRGGKWEAATVQKICAPRYLESLSE